MKLKVLGIETACDDTAAAVVENGHKVLSNVVWNQERVHAEFGGVVPELAARRHVDVITRVIDDALKRADVPYEALDAVAVNSRHGLLRSVVVGVAAAKAISYARGLPLIGVHHIEGHIYSALIENADIKFPHLCLAVAGGHNLLIEVAAHGKYRLVGRTLDDAAGEAYDKVARFLGLGFPGGPLIDRLAKEGNPKAVAFPRPMIERNDYDFSFSGLKTGVLNHVLSLKRSGTASNVNDIVASFQEAVVDVLVSKTVHAARNMNIQTITVVGGVSANSRLRQKLTAEGELRNIRVIFPRLEFCTDNGAMIATAGFYRFRDGDLSGVDLDAAASAPLGSERMIYKV